MLLVHLFVLYVLVLVIFFFLLELAAVCDCGTLWTFLLTFLTYSLVAMSATELSIEKKNYFDN